MMSRRHGNNLLDIAISQSTGLKRQAKKSFCIIEKCGKNVV